MPASHRFRRIGRFLAGWLLLWFAAMAAGPLFPLEGPRHASCVPEIGSDAVRTAHAGPPQRHGHEGHASHACEDEARSDAHGAHAQDSGDSGDSCGSLSHCPLCLHAAAPPPPELACGSRNVAATDLAAIAVRVQPHARTDALPPARGPPRLS